MSTIWLTRDFGAEGSFVCVWNSQPRWQYWDFASGWGWNLSEDDWEDFDEIAPDECRKRYGVCPKPGECLTVRCVCVERTMAPKEAPSAAQDV